MKKDYRKLSDRQIGKLYHEWLKENKFIIFTDWETKVLNNEIKIEDIYMKNKFIKFGDIVKNEWASDINPHQILMFVRSTKRSIYCLSIKGQAVIFYNDKELKLTKIGSLDLSKWEQKVIATK